MQDPKNSDLRHQLIGPAITLVICLTVEILVRLNIGISDPPALLALAVVFSAFWGGRRSALASSALAGAYVLYFYTSHAVFLDQFDDNIVEAVLWVIAIPALGLITAALQQRARQGSLALAEKEHAHAASLQTMLAERERAEAALRQTELRYQTLIEQLPAISYVVDAEGEAPVLFISQQIETLLGFTSEEWRADPTHWRRQLHADDRDWVLAESARCAKSGESLNMEYRLLARDGRIVWVRDQSVLLKSEIDGRPVWHGVMFDISRLKRTEETLRQSEERHQYVVWATNDAIWDWNLETDEVQSDDGFQKLFHYGVEDFHHPITWWASRIHPDDEAKVMRSLRSAIESGEQFWSKEFRFRRADGTYASVFDRGYILRDKNGKPLRAIGATMDVSDRKQVEEALREAEGKYRTLVEQLPDVVYLTETGHNGNWVYVSPQIETLLGFDPQEWISNPSLWYQQLHPEDRAIAEIDSRPPERMEMGERQVAEYRIYTRDGKIVWVRDSYSIIPGGPGRARMVQGVFTDITEQKRAEQSLHDANQILTKWLRHSEQRSMELGLLNEMSSLLQNCRDAYEACVIVAPILRRLFPNFDIGVYTVNASRHTSGVVAAWVDAESNETTFQPDDCWALRRGEIYLVDSDHPGPLCKHLTGPTPTAYMCVPLVAQEEMLALIHLSLNEAEVTQNGDKLPVVGEGRRQLARTVADSMALALANLKLRNSLREQSIRDGLTGLFNRRYMEESLEREIHRAVRHKSSVGIIMLDIDHFKLYNDAHGHGAGDALLREVGRVLRTYVRDADIACRYGGEEFTLIMPEATTEVVVQRAERIRREIKRSEVKLNGEILPSVTVSAGVAVYPDHGQTGEDVLRASDEALYQAKREGRDRVVVTVP